MKIYVASRFTRKNDVKELHKKLIASGHTITKDWTDHEDVTPLVENQELIRKYFEEDIQGVKDADVFIALIDNTSGSTGMHTEIGVAISQFLDIGKPKVYVVGTELTAASYFHSAVNIVSTEEELLEELNSKY